jgi:hypothetical protein
MGEVAILLPLIVGNGAIALTVLIHGSVVAAILRFVRQARARGWLGRGFWVDIGIIVVVILLALLAHLVEIVLWAALCVLCGEFQTFGVACYHSGMNYTTLGYGDIVMSPAWRILGPVEATNGLLLFGVSTALVAAVIQRITVERFPDLRA